MPREGLLASHDAMPAPGVTFDNLMTEAASCDPALLGIATADRGSGPPGGGAHQPMPEDAEAALVRRNPLEFLGNIGVGQHG